MNEEQKIEDVQTSKNKHPIKAHSSIVSFAAVVCLFSFIMVAKANFTVDRFMNHPDIYYQKCGVLREVGI